MSDRGEQMPAHLERPVLTVGTVNDVPWRERLVSHGEHVLEGALNFAVVAGERAVFPGHAPAGRLARVQLGQALLLCVRRDVQMHLADHEAVTHQHLLELTHALDAASQVGWLRSRARTDPGRSTQQVLVPAAVQDRDPALGWQEPPVAPKQRPFAFDVVRRMKSVHGRELGIEPAEELVDHLAAACARNSGDDHDDSVLARLPQRELRVEQAVLQLRQFVLVLEPRQAAATQGLMQTPVGHDSLHRLRSRASGTCCVTQCTLPPPSRISRPGTPTTSRFGNRSCSLRKASRSRRGSSNGATMRRLPM